MIKLETAPDRTLQALLDTIETSMFTLHSLSSGLSDLLDVPESELKIGSVPLWRAIGRNGQAVMMLVEDIIRVLRLERDRAARLQRRRRILTVGAGILLVLGAGYTGWVFGIGEGRQKERADRTAYLAPVTARDPRNSE